MPSVRATRTQDGTLHVESIRSWRDKNAQSVSFRALSTILSRTELPIVAARRQAEVSDEDVFNVKIDFVGPIPDQKSSGRCWIFSTLNLIRIMTAKTLNLDDFELSEAYLYFFDRLTKSRTFLKQVAAAADLPLDSRLVATLFANGGAQDGGDFDSAIALIEEYGIVPKTVFPESWNSEHTGSLDALLMSKLREYGLAIRKLCANATSHTHVDAVIDQQVSNPFVGSHKPTRLQKLKTLLRVIVLTLGMPPLPTQKFLYEYRDKNHKFHSVTHTPISFARSTAFEMWRNAICLHSCVNSRPLDTFVSEWTSQGLGPPPKYVCVHRDDMRAIAIDMLKHDVPVWFAMDVLKDGSPRDEGILDTHLYDFKDTLGVDISLTQAEAVSTGDSFACHAMIIVGVHLDERGRAVRWRVLNSWGEKFCKKGIVVMSDEWFEKWVYQIGAPRQFVPPAIVDAYDHNVPTKLAPWDLRA